MDDLLEIVFELVGGILGEYIDNRKGKFSLHSIDADEKDHYIMGMIATTLALCYADDNKIDRHERKMINQLIKKYENEMSKKTKKSISYIKRKKLPIARLKLIYVKLDIDKYTIIKMIKDLEYLLRELDKDTTKQKEFLSHLEIEYNSDYIRK